MATAKKPISENSKKVLTFLKDAGVGVQFTMKQIQEGASIPTTIVGSISSFVKKGWVERTVNVVANEDGKTKEVKYFALTEKGRTCDPDADAE